MLLLGRHGSLECSVLRRWSSRLFQDYRRSSGMADHLARMWRVTTKEKAQEIADGWRNPKLGFHTQVIRKDFGWICRIVINNQ